MAEKEITLKDDERQECEVWTRVMGYFRPVSNFNVGKKQEYAERVCFSEGVAIVQMEKNEKERQREKDVYTLAMTIWGEARGESLAGKKAVACVVMNRYKAKKWFTGQTIAETCTFCVKGSKYHQFSCWNENDPSYIKMKKGLSTEELGECLDVAAAAVSGELKDFLNGACHYHALNVKPKWAEGKMPAFRVGNHYFYCGID